MQGASISASWYSEEWGEYLWVGDAVSDKDGLFSVADVQGYGPGQYQLTVRASGYVTSFSEQFWDGGGPLSLAIALQAADPIAQGKVLSSSALGTFPVKDALVDAAWFDETMQEYVWAGEGVSDALGRYAVFDEQEHGAGEYVFHVEAVGYATSDKDANWDGGAALSLDFDVASLPRIATGVVRDVSARNPIPGAQVQARQLDVDSGEYVLAGSAYTAADGTYVVYDEHGFGPGDYQVGVSAAGFAPQTRSGTWNAETPLAFNFVLSPPATLAEGAVFDLETGDRLDGARVTVYHYLGASEWEPVTEVYTDADGLFAVRDELGTGSGGYKFEVESAGYFAYEEVDEWGGAEPLQFDFKLTPIPAIAMAKVVDSASSKPVVGARVDALRVNAASGLLDWAGTGTTDADGVFLIFDELAFGASTYEFEATAAGYQPGTHSEYWAGGAYLEFSLALDPIPPIATGKVTTEGSGAPIAGARVTAFGYDSTAGQTVVSGTTTTAVDGTYAIYDSYGIGSGEYELQVEAEGHFSASEYVAWDGAVARVVDFALVPEPPVVAGTVSAAGAIRAPIKGARVEASWYDSQSASLPVGG